MEPRKYQYVDSLRGIAILLVVLLHTGQAGSACAYFPTELITFVDNGQFGVQLFFIVSSYTLMLSYYSRKDEAFATRNFFVRRFFRIAPLYYLAICYYAFQNFIGFSFFSTGHVQNAVSVKELVANLFFLNGFRPTWINHLVPGGWSIAIEFTFYLILPLLCQKINNINKAVTLVCITLLISSLLNLNHVLGATILNSNNFLYWYFPHQLPIFALGILAFFISCGDQQVSSKSWLFIAFTIFAYCYLAVPYYFVYCLVFVILLLVLTRHEIKWIANSVTAYIGKVSFSIYLVHFAVLYWLERFSALDVIRTTGLASSLANFAFRYTVVLAGTIAVSHFTYHYIEVVFQKLGKRFIKTSEATSLQASSIMHP